MRKVLSFVLVLALVLSSFSMAFAADTTAKAGLTDVAGNANEDAIQVNYDLGIVTGNPDGTFLPAKAVTRAEFAAMLTRALDIPDSALAGYTATTFKDTAGYTWAVPYLAFCQSKGILLGDGAGNVMPGKTITVNEAMTMAMRAVGYTANSALLVGAWPANYVSLAQNNDMYDDVAKTITVDKANAAQIIYNLLTVQKVSVNSDGSTDLLWVDGDEDGDALNLLNSNLGCESDPDVVLGFNYDYSDAKINITKDMGAYGTAYLNDDELVAFTKDSTALTGYIDDGEFVVGDDEYTFAPSTFTGAALIANTTATVAAAVADADFIETWAAANTTNNDEAVTLNVDLSGKKIKEVYSVVGWAATAAELAPSDVQTDIADEDSPSILGCDFALNDDDVIDTNSFLLKGVASLDKIAEDDVVYVYQDDSDDHNVRMVAVGTETVQGTVDEVNEDDVTITIADKEYNFAEKVNEAISISAVDVDDEGTFYLDADGKIFDFDGTVATDTYGLVKSYSAETDFDNFKIKLYKSDDSTKTMYLSEEDPGDISWVSEGATTIDAIVTGAIIGYSLDTNGDIDTIDNTVISSSNINLQSTKVIYVDGESYGLAANVAVFTYDGDDYINDMGDFDVASIKDVDTGRIAKAGLATMGAVIVNEDGDVAALLVHDSMVDADTDNVYGVINARTKTKNADDEDVFRFKGFIDGTAFTKLTDDDALAFNGFAETFGVYEIVVDTNDVITEVNVVPQYTAPETSGKITPLAGNPQITDLNSDKTVITCGTEKYTVDDNAIVYKYDTDDNVFTVSKLSALQEDYFISLYDTKGDDADGSASVVIYYED